MKRNVLIITGALALAGCTASSVIQREYNAQQNICRNEAAESLSIGANGASGDSQTAAGARFSECMNKTGWRVSMPKASPGPVAQGPAPNPPTGSPSTNPHAAAAAAPPPQTATQYAPPMAAPQPATVSAPAVVQPGFPPPARYQPARPPSVEAAPYGTGAGRQF